jgi:predicted ATPase
MKNDVVDFKLTNNYIYGREKEIKLFEDYFSSCEKGKNLFVLIEGEAGIGKQLLLKR